MPNEFAVDRAIRGELRIDAAIAALADRQWGLVTRPQLVALGLSHDAIDRRLRSGYLHPVHRGVYAVGHRVLRTEAHHLAAVLASGPGAALSHRSAAALWAIRPTSRTRIDVTVPRRNRPRKGIDLHYAVLPPDELTILHGIPVTTLSRTILDFAAVSPPHHVERAMTEAEVRRLGDPVGVQQLLDRYPGRPGTPTIKRILAAGHVGAARTRTT